MSKKVLSYISGITVLVTIPAFFIWAYFAKDQHGKVHLEGNEFTAYLFLALSLLAVTTGSIALRGTKENNNKVSKKTVLSGLAVAVIFVLWRLSLTR
ncbi:hypothetical protein [Mesobacillus jeotgali]|uniref:hypothetical protein n=1 Tax=Mesobacillus jeotgali TaxID=129985 RepID=UPI0009A7D0E2|nr:hypothetical protein [Mesobacillus jeotgali]